MQDIRIYDIMSRGFLHLNPTQAIRTGLVQEENNELSGLKTIIIKTPSEYNRTERNWGGQILFEYAQVKVPKTKEELQDAVVSAPGTVRVVGRGLVYITYKFFFPAFYISLTKYNYISSLYKHG